MRRGGNLQRRGEIGQARKEHTRRRLLEAGARTVAMLGDRGATIEDFISAAQITRGTFYNYFKTRNEIIDALWENVGRAPYLELLAVRDSIADPAHRLSIACRYLLAQARSDVTWGWLVYRFAIGEERLRAALRAYPLADLQAGCESKRFRLSNVDGACDLVVGTMSAALRTVLSAAPPPDYDLQIVEMIMMALGLGRADAAKAARAPMPVSLASKAYVVSP
jgi:AcrR family transcriptional regulator